MSDLEERLRAELRRRADVDVMPVSAGHVRARAARLQRRTRLGAAAGVVAAVLVIVLPIAMLTTRSADNSPPQPAPGGPTPTLSDDSFDRVTVREWVDSLPTGPAPAIEYQAGLTFVAPDGTERTSRYPNVLAAFVRFGSGYMGIGSTAFEGTLSMITLSPDLRTATTACTLDPPALSSDGSRVWWGTAFCPETGSSDPATIRSAPVAAPDDETGQEVGEEAFMGVLGPVEESNEPTAEVAYGISQLSRSDGASPPQVRVAGEGGDRLLPLEFGDDASAAGLVAGSVGRELAVVDATTNEELWRTSRGYGPAEFSPDGRHLLSGRTVFDARTGAVVVRLASLGLEAAVAWEDEDDLLVGVGGGAREAAIIRFDLAGDAEVAVDWRPASARGNPPSIGFEVLP